MRRYELERLVAEHENENNVEGDEEFTRLQNFLNDPDIKKLDSTAIISYNDFKPHDKTFEETEEFKKEERVRPSVLIIEKWKMSEAAIRESDFQTYLSEAVRALSLAANDAINDRNLQVFTTAQNQFFLKRADIQRSGIEFGRQNFLFSRMREEASRLLGLVQGAIRLGDDPEVEAADEAALGAHYPYSH